MRLFICLLLISSSVLIHGCGKEKLKVHVVNVYCYDSVTGEPVQGEISLWVHDSPSNSGGYSDYSKINTIHTDANGRGTIEFPVDEDRFYNIAVTRSGFFKSWPYSGDPRAVQSGYIKTNSSAPSNFDFAFDPYYSYHLTTINTSCTGPTDSLWIETSNTWKNEFEVTGCADSIFNSSTGFSGGILANVQQVTFIVTSKKSGIVNTFSVTHDLTLGTTPDQIVIEY